ncbi:LysR family transcriptional regulator [Iamia sp. SCSIO 61187]|uniref:LysR family transcriptional regulator n=1 Tax=Iamia sp. SCSIO 61187 TaxID=2722752 RepID=UPI001C6341D5|nr:LysR family transcriptional regulator [Iamia sp. SCSIO 61187]QYG92671.1 LysR family transcriptional regulator [Iamia sp. SCSIO 61187]
MEIRQLEHVAAVVDEGGFTAAADAVGITQPALSQSVAALERELGLTLFVRGRQVVLTAAGEAFLGPARQVLRAASAARQAAADVAGLEAGRLDLVALPTLAVDPLADLVGRFRLAHPSITVRISAPDLRVAVIEQVRRGDAELGLAEVGRVDVGLDVHPVASHEVVLVAPPGTRLAQTRRVARHRLGDLDLVSTPVGTSTRALLDDACEAAGVEPHVVVETAHREALAPLVVAGAGSALLAEPQARQAAAGGAVVARLDPPLRREVGFVHRRGALSPAARAFLDLAPTAG